MVEHVAVAELSPVQHVDVLNHAAPHLQTLSIGDFSSGDLHFLDNGLQDGFGIFYRLHQELYLKIGK